jgi:hypothetical protein
MLRKTLIVLVVATLCSSLVLPRTASAGEGVKGWHRGFHPGFNVPPGFALDAATRLGVYSEWYATDYYPYYSYYSVYPSFVPDELGGGCHVMRRPVLTGYGWRMRTVQVCG